MPIGRLILPAVAAAALFAAASAIEAGGPRPPSGDAAATGPTRCFTALALPEGREELGRDDVRFAIERHLAAVGMEEADLSVAGTDDDTYLATIDGLPGDIRYVLEVDGATGEIIELTRQDDSGAATSARDQAGYNDRLRHHLMGDGQAWAEWVGRMDTRLLCGDDYGDGGPELPDPSPPAGKPA